MTYVKPWDKTTQVDKSVTDLARQRLECLLGTDPLYNVEFFGDKNHGFRCTLYSDVLDISWFSLPAANIYVCFQYLLVQILTAKHSDEEDANAVIKIKNTLEANSLSYSQDEIKVILDEINEYRNNYYDEYQTLVKANMK